MNLSEWTVSGSDDYGCVWITHTPCGEDLGDIDAPANLAGLIERIKAHTPEVCAETRREWSAGCSICGPVGRFYLTRSTAFESARFHAACTHHRTQVRKMGRPRRG